MNVKFPLFNFISLVTNVRVTIKFTNANTATNATLNINSTGTKPIYYHGTNVPNNIIVANSTINLVYNGTQYEIVGDFSASSSSLVTGVKGEAESTYRSGNVNITKSNLGLTTDEMGIKWSDSNITSTSDRYKKPYYANGIWVIGSDGSGVKYSTFNSLNDLGSAFKGISELKSYADDTFATKSYVDNHKLFL